MTMLAHVTVGGGGGGDAEAVTPVEPASATPTHATAVRTIASLHVRGSFGSAPQRSSTRSLGSAKPNLR